MENDIKLEKAENLALDIIDLYRFLTETSKEFVISKQLLRSGTSIGANIAEAIYAESGSDFIHKLGIAQKEANETLYWIRLLKKAQFIDIEQAKPIYLKTQEILRILTSVICSMKAKTGRQPHP